MKIFRTKQGNMINIDDISRVINRCGWYVIPKNYHFNPDTKLDNDPTIVCISDEDYNSLVAYMFNSEVNHASTGWWPTKLLCPNEKVNYSEDML